MLTFHFSGKTGEMTDCEKLTAGSIGKQVCITFSPEWDGLEKTAIFMALEGSIHTACAVDANQDILVIPAEVLLHTEHRLYVQVQGFTEDGAAVINSDRVPGPEIEPGVSPDELPELDTQNPVWLDVLSQMGNLKELETGTKATLVSAINELALTQGKDGLSAYEVAVKCGFEGSASEWLESLKGASGKSAYAYALDAGYEGTEEEFSHLLSEGKDLLIVSLAEADDGAYAASATYYEIAHARAQNKLVFLRYGVFITHILAGSPTDTSFLFEPLLHSIPGIHGYIVDSENNWSDAESAEPVYVSDIVNDLATTDPDKPLSAAQGVVLKGLIDDLAREGNEVLIYGYADAAAIGVAVMSGRPVYCLYEHLYYLPLVSWEETTATAVFGGCYGSTTITCKAVAGEWSVETTDVSACEPEVFIGTADTTVAEFNAAFSGGKPCFLMKANAGEGIIMWVAYTCNSSSAKFYRVTSSGSVQYGVLSSDGTFSYETAETESEVFIGDGDTTVEEFYEAFVTNKKPCFMMRGYAGAGQTMWTAYTCNPSNAQFYRITGDGAVQYGTLNSDGTFDFDSVSMPNALPFVGDTNTTVAEFCEAYSNGRACFVYRPMAGGMNMWTMVSAGINQTQFISMNSVGTLYEGVLNEDGTWEYIAHDIPTKTSQLTNDSGYLTEHQDISGKLDASELTTAINTALAQAKASGEFDGAAGATPAEVIAAMNTETWSFTLEDGSTLEKVVPLV